MFRKGRNKVKAILIIVLLLAVGCAVLPKDPHPELNRIFRVGIDTPGEYPY
jgi:hypothetical protein